MAVFAIHAALYVGGVTVLKFLNSESSLISRTHDDGRVEIIEAGDARFSDWVAEGVAKFVPPVAVGVQAVSRVSLLAALMDAGLLGDVQMALEDAGPLAQLAWAEASEFRRNSYTIIALALGLGLTDEQVDALFSAAAQIEV